MIFYAYFFCCLSQNNYLCTLIFSLLLNMQSHPTWVRGLKQPGFGFCLKSDIQSHPTWVRGLKHKKNILKLRNGKSHPTWVRGLKLCYPCKDGVVLFVAPYVGAWIETPMIIQVIRNYLVAPYVGAWIETSHQTRNA